MNTFACLLFGDSNTQYRKKDNMIRNHSWLLLPAIHNTSPLSLSIHYTKGLTYSLFKKKKKRHIVKSYFQHLIELIVKHENSCSSHRYKFISFGDLTVLLLEDHISPKDDNDDWKRKYKLYRCVLDLNSRDPKKHFFL